MTREEKSSSERRSKEIKVKRERIKRETKRRYRGREGHMEIATEQQPDWRWRHKMKLKPKGHQSLQIAKGPLQHWNTD